MSAPPGLPVIATAKAAYRLLWTHRALHAKAIWPPIVFLVAAEFLFHKVVGNAHGFDQIEAALRGAAWYWLAGMAVLWLAGLKFLLSFSISWRRHVMLGEKFDSLYFKRSFWKYLSLLVLLYVILILMVYISMFLIYLICCGVIPALMHLAGCSCTSWSIDSVCTPTCGEAEIYLTAFPVVLFLVPIAYMLRFTIRLVPRFTAIAVDEQDLNKLQAKTLMHGSVLRYLAIWILVMLPIFAATELLGMVNMLAHLDASFTPVALAESAFRQACFFTHFYLGASIGMLTYARLVQDRGPETVT